MHARFLALSGFLSAFASAAYVQHQACDGDLDSSSLTIDYLRTNLTNFGEESQRLSWGIGLLVSSIEDCNRLAENVSVTFSTSTLFGSSKHDPEPKVTCNELGRPIYGNSHELMADFERVSEQFYPLATFHSEIQVHFAYNDTSVCTQANITPALSHMTDSLFRWLPISIFLFVLLIGVLRSYFDKPIRLPDAEGDEDATRNRPILPNVGDCLNYLQFIFLTGALSLSYPGFYRPAVSNLNWFSLLLPGPVTKGFVYPSINDGIYEINGTYGGTYGLELMHQIVGAPRTMESWLNMAIAIVIISVVVSLVLEGVEFFSPKMNIETTSQDSSMSHIRLRFNRLLRAVLSYFTLPLITLSFYQFDNAAWLPGYHTALATLLLLVIVASFIWLIRQIPIRSLGMLVFDAKRYQSIPSLSTQDRSSDLFIMILFVVSIVRGIAIGGLQISGPAQLAVLGSIEVILLVSISGFQAYPVRSVGTISAVLRLVSVGLMMAFLPSLGASLQAKSLIGYVLLAIHAVMLLCGFLLPAAYSLCVLAARSQASPEAEAYGLRPLHNRSASSSVNILRHSTATRSPTPSSPYASPRLPSSQDRFSADIRQGDQLHPPNYFFRPPRPSSGSSFRADDISNKRVRTSTHTVASTSASSRSTSSNGSHKVKPNISLGAIEEPRPGSTYHPRSSESSASGSAPASSPTASTHSSHDSQGRPLGPRWNDYSFREADLYYMVGQRGQQEAEDDIIEEEEPDAQANSWKAVRKVSSGLWSKVTSIGAAPAVEERGFSVVRPNRPPPGAHMPPHMRRNVD